MTNRPAPLRFQSVNMFLESARDMGDPAMIQIAMRVRDAVNYPRAKPCSAADIAVWKAWENS